MKQGKRVAEKEKRHSAVRIIWVIVLIAALLAASVLLAKQSGLFFFQEAAAEGEPDTSIAAIGELPEGQGEAEEPEPVEEEPEQDLSGLGITVCVDPGHGGSDPGGNYGNRLEKDDVLTLGLAVQDAMEAKGIEVIMTRDDDTLPSLTERCTIANNAGVDYFISIHRNSADVEASGIEIWTANAASSEATALAQAVDDGLVEVGVAKNRGVSAGSQDGRGDYMVLRNTEMSSILIEMGFIESYEDNRYFDQYVEEYAEAIAQAVVDTYTEYQRGGGKDPADSSESAYEFEDSSELTHDPAD